MKQLQSFCVPTEGLTAEDIEKVLLLAVEAGAEKGKWVSRLTNCEGIESIGVYTKNYFKYFGVTDGATFFEDSVGAFGEDVIEFTYEDPVDYLEELIYKQKGGKIPLSKIKEAVPKEENEPFVIESIPRFKCTLYIAGNKNTIEEECAEFCEKGACVSIQETSFVYTAGREFGAAISIISYARFPKDHLVLREDTIKLGEFLLEKCHQHTCTVLTDQESIMITRSLDTVKEK